MEIGDMHHRKAVFRHPPDEIGFDIPQVVIIETAGMGKSDHWNPDLSPAQQQFDSS